MAVTFGDRLRDWRTLRRMSQLELAAEAAVSQRHISFLETGRARPSREMVIHLASTLEVPLRNRNELLDAAGFAPAYRERALGSDQLAEISDILTRLLAAYQPFPAYIVDRLWNLVASNDVATRLLATALPDDADPEAFGGNVMRLFFHEKGIRAAVVNWNAVANVLLRRLAREVDERASDDALRAVYAEAVELAERSGVSPSESAPAADELLVPIILRTPVGELETFTTIATIGGAHDVTLEELRIEVLLPATAESEARLRTLAAG